MSGKNGKKDPNEEFEVQEITIEEFLGDEYEPEEPVNEQENPIEGQEQHVEEQEFEFDDEMDEQDMGEMLDDMSEEMEEIQQSRMVDIPEEILKEGEEEVQKELNKPLPGQSLQQEGKEMFDIGAFVDKMKTDLDGFLTEDDLKKLEENKFMLAEDFDKNPQFYLDKELEKERMNRLIEAVMLKKQIEADRKKAEELANKANNAMENLTGIDLDGDGKIGGKENKKEEKPVVVNPVDEPKPDEPKPDAPKNDEPKPDAPKEPETKPLPKVIDSLYDVLEKTFEEDKKRYPDKYDTPEHSLERQKQLHTAAKAYLEKLGQDYKDHPQYYTTAENINDRKQLIKNAVEVEQGVHPKGSKIEKLARQNPIGGLDSPSKTMTDMMNAGKTEGLVSFEDLLKIDAVRLEDGSPFPQGLKPWEVDQTLQQLIEMGRPVYIEDPKGKIQQLTLDPAKPGHSMMKPYGTVERVRNERLVDVSVKKGALDELREVQKQLDSMEKNDKMSQEFVKLKESVNDTIRSISKTPFKSEFKHAMEDFSDKADAFLKTSVGKKNTKEMLNQKSVALQIRNINKAVQSGKVPEKTEPNLQDTLRFEIASRAIKSYANSFKSSKDEVKQGLAEHINSSDDAFMKEVEKAMKNPGFVRLFGDSNHPVDEEFLKKSATSKGSNIIKAVSKTNKELDERQIAQYKENSKRSNRDLHQPVSDENKLAMKKNVSEIRKNLMKHYSEGKDPDMDKLMFDLEVAEIRLNTGSKWMNYNKLSAQLADDAEKVHNKYLESGEWFNTRYTTGTAKLMHMDDCIKNNKSLNENPYDVQVAARRDLAAKIVLDSKKLLEKSDKQRDKEALANLERREIFDKKVNEVMESPAFKEMTNNKTDKELKAMLRSSAENTAITLGKVKSKMDNANLTKSQIKEKEAERELQKTENEKQERQIEKESVKQVQAPSAIFR